MNKSLEDYISFLIDKHPEDLLRWVYGVIPIGALNGKNKNYRNNHHEMRYVRGSLEAFLDGKKELNWVKGTIKNSGILHYKGMLKEILDGLRRYSGLTRYQSIFQECRKEGWLKS